MYKLTCACGISGTHEGGTRIYRGYTGWLSALSYHHCKCMMHVGEGEGIYSLAFCSVLSPLQVYDACGGGGGVIQLGFLL